jgi:putative glutamine amidotransferase
VSALPTPPLIVVTSSSASQPHTIDATENEVLRYVDAVRRHGGNPVVLDHGMPEAERDALFRTMAGLLLTGGPDIDPALYGEASAGSRDVARDRDQLELSAWEAAAASAVPLLGICRGMQAINVFAGGSLVQDLPDHAGVPAGSGDVHTHDISVDPESLLARSLAAGMPSGRPPWGDRTAPIELRVNTFHHQAVNASRLAPGLRAVGWAPSSLGPIIEALEGRDHRWIVGVQCHPELTESTPGEFEGLFTAFIDAARNAWRQPSRGVSRS